MQFVQRLNSYFSSLVEEGAPFGKNGFFDNNKYIILVSFFFGIFANLTNITNPIYSVVDSIEAVYLDYYNAFMYVNNRFSSALMLRIFPFLSIFGISQVVGIFLLSLSAAIITNKLNISIVAKHLFSILFVTHPVWSYLIYFHFQFAYNVIGVFLAVIALLITFSSFDNPTLKLGRSEVIKLAVSIAILVFAIGAYQSNFIIYLSAGVFLILMKYFEDFDFKRALIKILYISIITLISIAIYFVISALIIDRVYSQSGFMRSFFGIIHYIGVGFTVTYRQLTGIEGFQDLYHLPAAVSFILFMVLLFVKYKSRAQRLQSLLLVFILLGALFAHTFPLHISIWGTYYLALYFAIAFILIYTVFNNNLWKAIILVVAVFTLFLNMQSISKNQQAQLVSRDQDIMMAQRLMDVIYDKAPEVYSGKLPLVFVGDFNYKLEDSHPILRDVNFFFYRIKGFQTIFIQSFLSLYGLPTNVEVVNQTGYIAKGLYDYYKNNRASNKDKRWLEAKEIAKSMPAYPSRDCVKVLDDYVLIKLGE